MSNQGLVNLGVALIGQLTADHPIQSDDTAVVHRLIHTPQILATLIAQRQSEKHIAQNVLVGFADNIETAFNLSDLDDLCFRVDIDFENVSGVTKSDKVRELVRLMGRHGRLLELVALCQQLRPHQNWGQWPPKDELRIVAKSNMAVVVDLASRYSTIFTDVATHLDENTDHDVNFLWFHNPNEDRHIEVDQGWEPFAQAFAKAIPLAAQLTGAKDIQFYLAGPGPILFGMGCVWGTVKKGTVYHLHEGKYQQVLTVSQKLHR